MRVLIVTAFSSTLQSSFESIVKAVISTQAFGQQHYLSLPQIDFDTVTLSTIDRYLYETGSIYMSKDAEKVPFTQLFDHLDLIFVDGDANLLPWFRRAEKLALFFRMCERTKKLVFAAACGMQMLVFLCSCAQPIKRVINGHGKGGSVQDVQRLSTDTLKKLTNEEVILENTTGDVYQYDHMRHEFFPVGNVGIHYHKAAQDSAVARTAILKSFTYVPQAVDDPYPVYMGKTNEAKCRVLKQCNQHWLVQGLGLQEFIVPQLNAWDMHPINVTQEGKRIFVLAESARGPQIVVWQENAVGVQFHIDPKYAETTKVLQNFITHNIRRFEREETRYDLPLSVVEHMPKPNTNQLLLDRERKLNTQFLLDTKSPSLTESRIMSGSTRPQTAKTVGSGVRPTTASSAGGVKGPADQSISSYAQRPTSAVTARHSGFAFSKRYHEPLIVGNNATTDTAVALRTERPISAYIQTTPIQIYDSPIISARPPSAAAFMIKGDFDKTASVSRLRSYYSVGNTVQVSPKPEINLDDGPTDQLQSEKTSQNTLEYKSVVSSVKNNDGPWKRQKEIRALLHPGYPIETMPKSGPRIFGKVRSESSIPGKKVIRLSVARVSYTSGHKPEETDTFQKTRTTNYPNLGLTVANDGTVYKDPESRRREEEKASRKKWTSCRDFDVALSKRPGTVVIQNYVRLTPSEPPATHVFRSEDKEKWLAGQFRVPSY